MKNFRDYTLKEYADAVSKRSPVPGGGSVAALNGALGVALLSMVANYSMGRAKDSKKENAIVRIFNHCEKIKLRLLGLVDLDAQAYMSVVNARKKTKAEMSRALKQAQKPPQEVKKLCYQAIQYAPELVLNGNQFLVSDVQVACEMLLASFRSAQINIEINQ